MADKKCWQCENFKVIKSGRAGVLLDCEHSQYMTWTEEDGFIADDCPAFVEEG